MNPDFAERIGVDIDNLIFVQPSSGEEGLDITEELIKSNGISIIVVDSVAALVPQAELDGEISDANIGLQARMMSKAMRKIISAVNKSETIVIFINQLREKVGVMFGNPETTPGGRALSFYASLRLDVRRVEQIKDGKDVVGNKVKVTVRKNKVGSPFKVAIFDLMFSDGVSMSGSVLDLGVDYGFVEKSGAWFSYNGTRIGQGREAAKSWFENNEEEMVKLREKILEEVSAH
jgi:recombination protein RecA